MTVRRCVCSIAVCSALVLAAAGCHKKVAAAPPAPPPAPTPTAPVTPPPPPPPPAPNPAPAPRPLSEDDVFARKTVDQLNAERPLDDVSKRGVPPGQREIPPRVRPLGCLRHAGIPRSVGPPQNGQ